MEDQRPMVTITADEYFAMRLAAENSRFLNQELLDLRVRQGQLDQRLFDLENQQKIHI